METVTRLILPDVAQALATDPTSVAALTEEMHAADLADLAISLEPDLRLQLVLNLPVEAAAPLFEALDEAERLDLFIKLVVADRARAVGISEAMAADDRADLFGHLPEDIQRSLLERMEREESRDVRQLLAYAEGTAGAIMTTEFVALPADASAQQAIDLVRASAAEMETIYDAYAVDPHGILLGAVSLRDLVLARPQKKVADIMDANAIAVDVEADQEEVVRLIAKYDLLAIPVIDRARHIVGIVTVDDVMDVAEEEATEDVQRLGAVEPLEATYLQTGFWEFVRKRAPWLILLFLAGFLTSDAMRKLTVELDALPALLWFVPLIISAGGNAGSQSATLVIRALAVGEVEPRDFLKVLGREVGMGIALGVILAVFGVGRALAWEATRTFAVIEAVSLSILAVVTVGAVVGAGFPLLLHRLGQDPAVSSTPFIASVSDVIGLVLYLSIAGAILL